MVPIRLLYDGSLPYSFTNGIMHPMKPVDKEPDLNGGFDPLVSVKLASKKIGLIFPNSGTPVDVSCNPVKRIDSIVIHIHGGGFVSQTSSDHLGYL